MPGVSTFRFQILPSTCSDLADLSGFIARSHGMPLRECINHLKRQFHTREFKRITLDI